MRQFIKRDIYISNIFNPSQSDNNIFRPFTEALAQSIDQFRVFDRWGEKVFDIVAPYGPRQSTIGWDGTFNGRNVESGFYVYVIAVTLDNGSEEIVTGSITLVY